MQDARRLARFLLRAVIIGLAAAFLLVWWKPALLGVSGANALPGFADAVARAAPAVVNIYTARVVTERAHPQLEQLFGDHWPLYRQRVERSLGSGVIVDAMGTIITNQHVIAGAKLISVQLADGRVAEARVKGEDPDTDIAVLDLSIDELPFMPLGRSDTLRAGDIVLAIGNPYGLSQTVTQGIVSATGRGQLGLATFENFIQTDAAINLGNSGGALIDAHGALVGINTAMLNRTSGGSEGIGFAIPVNLVRGVMKQILDHGRVVRGGLGFELRELPDGAVSVGGISADSLAYRAGVRPGDVITNLDGKRVTSVQELDSRVAALEPGANVVLEGRRGSLAYTLELKVIERPNTTNMPTRPG